MLTRWVESLFSIRCPGGYKLQWVRGRGWCSARHIHSMIEQGQAAQADIIVFLDADVVVPPHWLESMVKHYEQGKRVVSAVVPMRGQALESFAPFEGMAWKTAGNELVRIDPYGGIQEIDYASAGAVLFDARIFDDLPKPWTQESVRVSDGYRRTGSTPDSTLFQNIKKAGVKIYADPSVEVKHLNLFEIDSTFPERFKDWVQPELQNPTEGSLRAT